VNDDEMIAKFLREKGATKCPPAICAPTAGLQIEPEVAQAHAARGIDPAGDAWRKKRKGGWTGYWKRERVEVES
jgi:hypothetical protein